MKLTTVIIIGVFTIATAIRVPTSWPKNHNNNRYKTRATPMDRSETVFQSRPHGVHQYNKINTERKYQPYSTKRHLNLKNQQSNGDFKASASNGGWRPIFPAFVKNEDAVFRRFRSPVDHHNNFKSQSPLHKNYRDDKTHEPDQDEETIERHTHKEKVSSDHEIPPDVPTKPIYPGEGQWAKRGKTHRPYVSNHKYTELEDDSEEKKPDGYEVFQKNQKLFDKHKENFREKINDFPRKHNLEPQREEQDEREEENEESEEEQHFIPTKLYTQVRRTENVQHLPRLVEEPRLREVIKDSKIQTVYTEEGYEDIAYDHAGHEKIAEEDEGYVEFDKEIEKERQRKARKQKEADEADSETAGSQYFLVGKPSTMKKNNLMKVQEIKTTSVKDKENGNSELEILNELKVLSTPNNGTKTHRFIKIVPKAYRYDVNTESPVTEEKDSTTGLTSSMKLPDMLPVGSTTIEVMYKRRKLKRFKRFTNDFPKINVDADFIDKINHNFPPQPPKIEGKPKYPYYHDKSLHPDSPLRYAEDMDNIPKKTEDELAFYHQAERIQCPEIEDNVDPIPQRIKNADRDPENVEDATDVEELVQGPRLKNLGDKIDCLKIKYFGENPLDSPIFQEKLIGPVTPIFELFELNGGNTKHNTVDKENYKNHNYEEEASSENVEHQEKFPDTNHNNSEENQSSVGSDKQEILNFNILTDVLGQLDKTRDIEEAASSESKAGTTERSNEENEDDETVVSIITTPKYTINLKPKHIYHQIELLNYLPQVVVKSENETKNSTEVPENNHRQGKSMEESTTPATDTEDNPPESQALRKRRRRIRPKIPIYYIFDVNRFLPSRPHLKKSKIVKPPTVIPQHDAFSEVHYKQEIKPSEQLTVFADVINNIKNSTTDPLQTAASIDSYLLTPNGLNKYRRNPFHNILDNIGEINSFYLPTTTTSRPKGTAKYSAHKTKEDLYEDMYNRDRLKYENLELLKVNRKTTTTSEPDKDTPQHNDDENENTEETISEVLGLVPPGADDYKTIYSPTFTKQYEVVEETKINQFHVPGMKPPPRKPGFSYSSFKPYPLETKSKYPYLRRGKRSAQRPAYSEVVRNRNKPIDVQDDTDVVVEDDEDYVPHRPKNYHYDEKTGRIVYDNVKKEEKEEEEEVEYVEVTEPPLPKPTRRNSVNTPKFVNFTGPSYVDFIKKIKSNPNYTEIPDPTTTEKGEEETTTTTTTSKPISTDPPQFLSILAKVRSDSNYKMIEDKTTSKTTTTTTTTTEIPEEETQLENVKNSPGGQSKTTNFQIFDISDYLPKVKSYSPRTSIDYSKYKTIERPGSSSRNNESSSRNNESSLRNSESSPRNNESSSRNNFSSRYRAQEETTEISTTTTTEEPKVPEQTRVEDTEINPIVSETNHEDVESTISTTELPSTTSIRRSRPRSRNRGSRRPTQRSSTTTSSPDTESEASPIIHHDKPKRTFPRRRPGRIKINRTTTTEETDSEAQDTTEKILRRRHQSETEAPEAKLEERIDLEPSEKKYRIVAPNQDIIELNITKPQQNQTKVESRKIDHVQVFQKYDEKNKHGGNYKRENEEGESKKVQEVKRLTDVVPKPSTFYTDEKLPKKVNQLMEVNVSVEEIEQGEKAENEEVTPDFDYEGEEEKTTTTKKPFFIKDPNKRLYYYAPV